MAQTSSSKIDSRLFKLHGYFLEDSIEIGLPVHYSLSIWYPSEAQILFPDEKYKFGTFELLQRYYFNTRTEGDQSIDSVVYELRTFEIDKIQALSLPVFVTSRQDTLNYPIFAVKDSVILKELVVGDPKQIPLQIQTTHQSVKNRFDYPFLIGIILLTALFFLIIWGILGARFKKYYSLFQFRTRQLKFVKEFTRLSSLIIREKSAASIELAMTLWKRHMEFLENKPFSTYTSKEISQLLPDEDLEKSLKDIDRAMYGRDFSREIENSLLFLKNFSENRFEKKYSRLRNV